MRQKCFHSQCYNLGNAMLGNLHAIYVVKKTKVQIRG